MSSRIYGLPDPKVFQDVPNLVCAFCNIGACRLQGAFFALRAAGTIRRNNRARMPDKAPNVRLCLLQQGEAYLG